MSVILQEQITLEEAVLRGMQTFPNGCNFRIIVEKDKIYLTYGCYGIHKYLTNSYEKLLHRWLTVGNYEGRKLLPISEPVIKILIYDRDPCPVCGYPAFKPIK